jgi:hypothetical protein
LFELKKNILGYWNGWENYEDWYWTVNVHGRKCVHCGCEFSPKSGNQKYCTREENPACDDDRYFEMLWNKGRHPLQLNDIANEQRNTKQ